MTNYCRIFHFCVDDEIDVTNVPFGALKVKDRLYVFIWTDWYIILSYHQVFFLFFECQSFYCLLIGYCTNKYNNKLITERGSMGRCALCEVISILCKCHSCPVKAFDTVHNPRSNKIISTFFLFGNTKKMKNTDFPYNGTFYSSFVDRQHFNSVPWFDLNSSRRYYWYVEDSVVRFRIVTCILTNWK